VENAYRLWRKFSQIHLNIRSQLTQQQGFPPVTKVAPCQQTWAHLVAAFGTEPDAVAAYQRRWQRGFFSSG
jgi:hypothetical protein